MLKDKVGMIFGVANKRSIAWACADAANANGATLAFTYQGERLKENVEKLAGELPDSLIVPCDVTDQASVDEAFAAVKEKLLFSLTNMGHPHIAVADPNYDNRGELLLKHRFDGLELRRDYATATLEALQRVWSRPVHLETVAAQAPVLLSYDGTRHAERALTAEVTA